MRRARGAPTTWVPLALAALAGCGAGPASPSALLPPSAGANVIVISFDALRADALGVYGYPRATSPRIDRFARHAVVFDRFYTAAPVTPTSFASAFTGRYPHRVFRDWRFRGSPTLAELFASAGYSTAAFLNNVQLTPERGFDRGFETIRVERSAEDRRVEEAALDWLERHRSGKIFVWIHFLNPHAPYDRREQSRHLYDPSYEGAYAETTGVRFETDDPREIERIRSLYDGEVFYADRMFGRILDRVEELGLLATSYVVLTADHGEEFKEKGHFQHGWLGEEHARVPLVIRPPGPPRPPARTAVPASNVDLLPTLTSLVGVDAPRDVDGRSLAGGVEEDRPLFSLSYTHREMRQLAMWRGRHKLVVECAPERDQRLYDLARDPAEAVRLESAEPDLAASMRRTLFESLELAGCDDFRMPAGAGAGDPARGLSDRTVESLRALGYLDDPEASD